MEEVRQTMEILARTCFKDAAKFARALELDEELVKRTVYILIDFKQKEGVNLDVLEQYCKSSYELFFSVYPWACMNPTVHKLWRHGISIAKNFPFFLIFYSEDAAESMHKLNRDNSLDHARLDSREHNLVDVFNRAVYTSDPILSLIFIDQRIKRQIHEALPEDFIRTFMTDTEIINISVD